MKYTGRREYDVQFETFIYRGEVEIPINCELSIYEGTHSDDDPSEVIVESCKVAETNEPYKKGDHLILTPKEQDLVEERYWVTK